mmetsp:Transcript_26109/g.38625  ORF Transcript_26109/g.38625 Transcript_26109/m.38625 type:complete len:516 (+) Transcript_26109:141-1688(+)
MKKNGLLLIALGQFIVCQGSIVSLASSKSARRWTPSEKTQNLFHGNFRHGKFLSIRGGSSIHISNVTEILTNTTTLVQKADTDNSTNNAAKEDESGRSSLMLSPESASTNATVTKKPIISLTPLLISNFLALLSVMTTALSPTPILIDRFGSQKATSILSSLSSLAAVIEICVSPVLGAILDSWGRKPAMILSIASISIINGIVSRNASPVAVSIAKLLVTISLPQFFVAGSAITADLLASSPQKMGSFMGIQMVLMQIGFIVGISIAGKISGSPQLAYTLSSAFALLSLFVITFGQQETLASTARVPFDTSTAVRKILQAPASAARLVAGRRGGKVRLLAFLLVLQTLPQQRGDIFQVYARDVWGLEADSFAAFVKLVGGAGLLSSLLSSILIGKMGIKNFTTISILSSLCFPLGSCISFRTGLIGVLIGFLASSQSLGVQAELVVQAGKYDGANQGELAGERASLLALTRVVGPLIYGGIFFAGSKVRIPQLMFAFDCALAIIALRISSYILW